MLRDVAKASVMDMDSLKTLQAEQGTRLMLMQQQIRQAKIPVIILFEGWDASGKGSMIGSLIQNLDPRGFKVFTLDCPDEQEKRFPYMHRYWKIVPLYGNMAILDGSWYRGVINPDDKPGKKELERRYGQILDFEKQLADDGYVVIKFFLHITRKEQKQRFQELEDHDGTSWRVTKDDWKQNRDYDSLFEKYDDMLERTDREWAPWTMIHATDKRQVAHQVYSVVLNALDAALRKKEADKARREAAKAANAAAPAAAPRTAVDIFSEDDSTPPVSREDSMSGGFGAQLIKMPLLADIDATHNVDDEIYRAELKDAQNRLSKLHNKLYQQKVPVVLGFEGWDAAGKGGAIKRLTRALDPRGFEVIPTAAPTPIELNHQYLWRFWNALPKDGHIAIFDRTWYGRVMVEKIEGFCTEEQWQRAYGEINRFERSLTEWGAVVMKFWLQIDSDEQLKRFTARQQTPEKQWKITDEDWRNRDKWPLYEQSVNEMLRLTSTVDAPWVIIESNDKKYARLKVLESVIEALEARL